MSIVAALSYGSLGICLLYVLLCCVSRWHATNKRNQLSCNAFSADGGNVMTLPVQAVASLLDVQLKCQGNVVVLSERLDRGKRRDFWGTLEGR